jgi:hypothetical protein
MEMEKPKNFKSFETGVNYRSSTHQEQHKCRINVEGRRPKVVQAIAVPPKSARDAFRTAE